MLAEHAGHLGGHRAIILALALGDRDHEAVSVAAARGAFLDDRIEADTVFIAKPTVFPRSAERVVARSHDVSWGDMVVVKDGGAERLGTRPQRLVSYT